MRFRVVLIFLVCYITVMGATINHMNGFMSVNAPATPGRTVIVDAGHGGFDGGAEGKFGTVEKDINLPIALALRDMLCVAGYNVVLTRDSDISTADMGLSGISQKKTSDILNRFALQKKYPDAIFVSIHQNKFPDSSQFGPQMFYSPESVESKNLAEILKVNFKTMVSQDNKRLTKKAEDGVYLIYNAVIPAVLVECGFLSNEREAELLSTEEYRNQVAFAVFASISEYFANLSGGFPAPEETL